MLERFIAGYRKSDEKLHITIPIELRDLGKVRDALGLEPYDPLYDCYPLTPQLEEVLRASGVDVNLDHERLDYFLESAE